MAYLWVAAAVAAKRQQDAEAREARRRRKEQEAREREYQEAKLKSSKSAYKYHTQPGYDYIIIKVEDISDPATREFLEKFYKYKVDLLKKSLQESKKAAKTLKKQSDKMEQRQKDAIKILRECMSKVKDTSILTRDFLDYRGPSARVRETIHYDPTLKQLREFTSYTPSLSMDFDFEAIHGVPLEQSNFFKNFQAHKEEFHSKIAHMETSVNSLKEQLSHTIWLPKRKELKREIDRLTLIISSEKKFIPVLDSLLDACYEFYNSIASLDKKDLKLIADAIEDGKSGKITQVDNNLTSTNKKVKKLQRALEKPVSGDYSDILKSFIFDHPEITRENLLSVSDVLIAANDEALEASGADLSFSYTTVNGEIATKYFVEILRWEGTRYIQERDAEVERED